MPDTYVSASIAANQDTTQLNSRLVYVTTDLYTAYMNPVRQLVQTTFGSDNIYRHNEYFITNPNGTSGAYKEVIAECPSLAMLFDTTMYAPIQPNERADRLIETGTYTQLSLTKIYPEYAYGKMNPAIPDCGNLFWVRDSAVDAYNNLMSVNMYTDWFRVIARSKWNKTGIRPVFAICG